MSPSGSASRHSLETASRIALFITLILAVLFFIPSASVPFAATKASLLALGAIVTFILYVLARLSRGNIILPPLALIGILWLPVVAYLLSALFSGVPFGTALWGSLLGVDSFGFVLIAACLGTLTALVVRRQDNFHALLKVLWWVYGILTALQFLVLILGQIAPQSISASFSLLGSPETLAFVLGSGVAGTLLAFRFVSLSRRAKVWMSIVGVVSLFLLAVSHSTLVWILLAIIALGLFVESVMKRGRTSGEAELVEVMVAGEEMVIAEEQEEGNTKPIVLPLVVLAVSLFFIIGSTLGTALANGLHANVVAVRPSWQSTLTTARGTYSSSPLFGSGPGTFGQQWLKYRDVNLNATPFWATDFTTGIGYIPTSLSTTGIVGALLWLGFIVLFILLGIRMLLMRAPEDRYVRFTAIISFISTLYFFGIMIFGSPNVVVVVLAFVSAGLFASTRRFARDGKQWGIIFSRSPRIGFVIVFLLTLLLLGSVVSAYALTEHYLASANLTRANVALTNGNLTKAGSAIQSSITFSPSASAYEFAASISLAQVQQIAASTTMSQSDAQQAFQAQLSSGINSALTATQINPNDYQAWLLLGNLYAQAVPLKVSGAYDSAKTAYQKAAALDPTNAQIPYTLAELDIANNDTKSAEADLKQAISLKQDYTDAIFLLSKIEVANGDVTSALADAKSAAYFTPNNSNILFQVGILSAATGDYTTAVQALSSAIAVTPNFANAHYFLAAVYAKQGEYDKATSELQALQKSSTLSDDNTAMVTNDLAKLADNHDPFPASLLSLSASSTPVETDNSASATDAAGSTKTSTKEK